MFQNVKEDCLLVCETGTVNLDVLEPQIVFTPWNEIV